MVHLKEEIRLMRKFKGNWNEERRKNLREPIKANYEARQRQPTLYLKRQKIAEAKQN